MVTPAFNPSVATPALNLRAVEPFCIEYSTSAFRAGDASGFVQCAYSTGGMLALVVDNLVALKLRGIFEAALVNAFTDCKINNRNCSVAMVEAFFRSGERQKMRAIGNQLPGTGPFFVYRGVAGEPRHRKTRGLSWTSNLDVACWYATRFHGVDPAIYMAEIRESDVFCFTNHRSESEFICRPKRCKRVPIGVDEMKESAARHLVMIKEFETKMMAKMKQAKKRKAKP